MWINKHSTLKCLLLLKWQTAHSLPGQRCWEWHVNSSDASTQEEYVLKNFLFFSHKMEVSMIRCHFERTDFHYMGKINWNIPQNIFFCVPNHQLLISEWTILLRLYNTCNDKSWLSFGACCWSAELLFIHLKMYCHVSNILTNEGTICLMWLLLTHFCSFWNVAFWKRN